MEEEEEMRRRATKRASGPWLPLSRLARPSLTPAGFGLIIPRLLFACPCK